MDTRGSGQLENLQTHTSREQSDGSKTEATLILCGYSGERANNRGDSTIKEEVRRRKMRKFADRQAIKQRTNGSKTETTLSSMDTRGSWPINSKFGLILYCTALFCTVLYKKRRMKEEKIRKFTIKQTKNRQTQNSNTEATLILCGYSGELANMDIFVRHVGLL